MKRHDTDLISLVFGVAFALVAGWWLVGGPSRFDVPPGAVGVAVLLLLGCAALASAVRTRRATMRSHAVSASATYTDEDTMGVPQPLGDEPNWRDESTTTTVDEPEDAREQRP